MSPAYLTEKRDEVIIFVSFLIIEQVLPFVNRVMILYEFATVLVQNLQLRNDPQGRKPILPLADHMFGAGKTYFGENCITQMQILLKNQTNPLDEADEEWKTAHKQMKYLQEQYPEHMEQILSACVVIVDLRYAPLRGDFAFALRVFLLQVMLAIYGKKVAFWDDKDNLHQEEDVQHFTTVSPSALTLGSIAAYFSEKYKRVHLILFDEVQCITTPGVIKVQFLLTEL